jgi:hypothetical protein
VTLETTGTNLEHLECSYKQQKFLFLLLRGC